MNSQFSPLFDSFFSTLDQSSSPSNLNFEENSQNDESYANSSFNNLDIESRTEESNYYINNLIDNNIQNINDNLHLENEEINNVNNQIFFCEKVKRPKFELFSQGKYDDFSKNIIEETLNEIKQAKKIIKGNSERRLKKIRKQNSDNIRKKIKSRFLKTFKNKFNEKLKLAGSDYFIQFLPQNFVTNITKKLNKSVLYFTLEEIFLKTLSAIKCKQSDIEKYKYNKFVLKYLEKNNDIGEKINFNKIKNMKYYEIFEEYLLSKEFGMEISNLKKEGEKDSYIKDYIINAKNFINFFSE